VGVDYVMLEERGLLQAKRGRCLKIPRIGKMKERQLTAEEAVGGSERTDGKRNNNDFVLESGQLIKSLKRHEKKGKKGKIALINTRGKGDMII